MKKGSKPAQYALGTVINKQGMKTIEKLTKRLAALTLRRAALIKRRADIDTKLANMPTTKTVAPVEKKSVEKKEAGEVRTTA